MSEKKAFLPELYDCLRNYETEFNNLLEGIIHFSKSLTNSDKASIQESINQIIKLEEKLQSLEKEYKSFVRRKKKIRDLKKEYDQLTQKIFKYSKSLSTYQNQLLEDLSEAHRLQKNIEDLSEKPSYKDIIDFARLLSLRDPTTLPENFDPIFPFLPDLSEIQKSYIKPTNLSIKIANGSYEEVLDIKRSINKPLDDDEEYEYTDSSEEDNQE